MPDKKIQHAVVQSVLQYVPAKGATVLDLSCGDGEILEQLAGRGYAVAGTHFRQDDYIFKKPSPILNTITVHNGVDLNRPLPFADASWDAVMATEVMEHLPSHVTLVEEVARILKPGGWFILSTPNIHRFSSRLQFLFRGIHDACGARPGWHTPYDELYSTHFNPVYFPALHVLLNRSGLTIRHQPVTRINIPAAVLLPFAYPFIALATLIELRHLWRRSPDGARDLMKRLLGLPLLLSKQMVIVAQKTN